MEQKLSYNTETCPSSLNNNGISNVTNINKAYTGKQNILLKSFKKKKPEGKFNLFIKKKNDTSNDNDENKNSNNIMKNLTNLSQSMALSSSKIPEIHTSYMRKVVGKGQDNGFNETTNGSYCNNIMQSYENEKRKETKTKNNKENNFINSQLVEGIKLILRTLNVNEIKLVQSEINDIIREKNID